MDTLLHEWAPTRSRALIFSTRDLVLGAVFITVSQTIGFALAIRYWRVVGRARSEH
jgi:hypothetical protein